MTKKVYCCACNKEIKNDSEPCECGCAVFTCPDLDVGFRYRWERFKDNLIDIEKW